MSAQQTTKNQMGKRKITPEELKAVTLEITSVLQNNLHIFLNAENVQTASTGKERQRLFGAGVKNYGFIENAFEIARDNPGFVPPHLNVNDLRSYQDDLEELRQLFMVLQQFIKAVFTCFLHRTDMCFRIALRIYAGLKEQSKNRVNGATPLYEALKPFFYHRKRQSDEPTEKQLERDVKKLLHGKADGEIIIKNESPRASGGKRTVVDNVRKGRAKKKE